MAARGRTNTDDIHLLVGGVEASLWAAEQWAADLRAVFPFLNVVVASSNKLISLDPSAPDGVLFSGSAMTPLAHITADTCVLMISQSGQTFPTLHATKKLAGVVGNRLWILTGCFQSKMELALVEAYKAMGAVYGRNRVFNNYSGNRPAEPTSVAIAATHHSLTRLLLHLVDLCTPPNDLPYLSISHLDDPSSLTTLTSDCKRDLQSLLTKSIIPGLEQIVGFDAEHAPLSRPPGERDVHLELVQRGVQWASHIQEPWSMMVCAGGYILLSVGLGMPIFGLLADAVLAVIDVAGATDSSGYHIGFSPRNAHAIYTQPAWYTAVGIAVQFVDALFFIYLVKIFTYLARWIAGRPLSARHGKRTLVIVDTPMVHQLTEIFVSKLFSQSYGFCGIDVHGASGLDHFVHRFTHRVVRGVLLAIGRPDGRLCSLGRAMHPAYSSIPLIQ